MEIIRVILVVVLAYLVGSIPSGWLVVMIAKGQDVRKIGSGRVGGTNVMRAAGFLAGLIAAGMDVLKGIASGWIVDWIFPGSAPWLRVAAATMAVVGQIYSIFLLARHENGTYKFGGGAGGATVLGGSIALWPQIWMISAPVLVLVFIFVGYASVTTISIAATALVVFSYRAVVGLSPWQYIGYGVLALVLVLWALRPNLKRLRAGTERTVGLRAYFQKKREADANQQK